MAQERIKVELLDEEIVRRTAEIIGKQSACARALDEAAVRRARGEDVVLISPCRGSILVVGKSALDAPQKAKKEG